jgi:hypothetical protein
LSRRNRLRARGKTSKSPTARGLSASSLGRGSRVRGIQLARRSVTFGRCFRSWTLKRSSSCHFPLQKGPCICASNSPGPNRFGYFAVSGPYCLRPSELVIGFLSHLRFGPHRVFLALISAARMRRRLRKNSGLSQLQAIVRWRRHVKKLDPESGLQDPPSRSLEAAVVQLASTGPRRVFHQPGPNG